jgi:hypothetical protein
MVSDFLQRIGIHLSAPAFVTIGFSRNNFMNILHRFGKTMRYKTRDETRRSFCDRNGSIPDSSARGLFSKNS